MQYCANKYARASEISSYYICPRRVYFERRRAPAPVEAEARAGVFKSVSLGLARVAFSSQPATALEEAIRLACSDAFVIYGPAYEQAIAKAGQEARERADEIITGLIREKENSGERWLGRLLSPASVSLAIYSDRLRISGAIDKVAYGDEGPMPVIVSTSMPPPEGIYAPDRVRLAAYAMLLAEKYNADCPSGAVEYIRGWCLRHAEIRHEDKRKALYARNRILEFDGGAMPDPARGKWCGRCGHYDACNIKATLLGSIFKKRR